MCLLSLLHHSFSRRFILLVLTDSPFTIIADTALLAFPQHHRPFRGGGGSAILTPHPKGETQVTAFSRWFHGGAGHFGDAASPPTGNLEATVVGMNAKAAVNQETGISGGDEQTITPLLMAADLVGAGEPSLLQIVKTVTASTGTCGVDDVDVLTINSGETVKYCYEVSNPGTSTLYDVLVIDDYGTAEVTGDYFTVSAYFHVANSLSGQNLYSSAASFLIRLFLSFTARV